MLFENVMAILDKCRDENLNDVGVAEAMLINENRPNIDAIQEAGDFLKKHYAIITKCRRLGKNDTIKAFVEGDEATRNTIIEQVAEINE